jgi:hypothetical protein
MKRVDEDEIKERFRPLKHYSIPRCGERFATVKG